jgi:hypothetical protein
MWMLMEIIQVPSLLKAMREDIETAKITDPATGNTTVHSQVGIRSYCVSLRLKSFLMRRCFRNLYYPSCKRIHFY